MKSWTSSSWISLAIILLIPLSWFIQFFLNQYMLSYILAELGEDVLKDIDKLDMLFLSIPIAQLVTLATVVIPAIFIRKAVREGTTNLTLPVGKNSENKDKPKNEGAVV